VTGLLSVLGSLWIVFDVCNDHKKRKTVYHRLMIGMAISDIMSSLSLAFSTWPVPQGTDDVFASLGNVSTCEVQGFFIQMGVATPLYNAFLAVYFLLLVKHNWSEKSMAMRRLEKIFHFVAWAMAFGTAFASLGLELYNNANLWCWIAPYPLDCENSVAASDGTGTCVRGDNAWLYRLFFYFLWLWIAVAVVIFSMVLMLWAVYTQAKMVDKYRQKGEQHSRVRQNMVRDVGMQCVYYIAAFLLTSLPLSVARMLQAQYNCTETYFPLSLTTAFLFPLQGFWNAAIYLRPRYRKFKQQNPNSSILSTVLRSLYRTLVWSDDSDYKLGGTLEDDSAPDYKLGGRLEDDSASDATVTISTKSLESKGSFDDGPAELQTAEPVTK